jgi:hypothetical protein
MVDGNVPLVAFVGLPDHHHQAPGRAQRPPDVGERGDGVVEEHRAESADCQVEALLRKAVVLCVCVLEGDVVHTFSLGELAGALDCGSGDVDPERTACLGRPRGLSGCLPGPASDVEDVVVRLDATGPAQYMVVPLQFGVVAGGPGCMAVGGGWHSGALPTIGAARALLVTGVNHDGIPPLSRLGAG